ncbi:hypothetical protein [Inquilinus sp. 2KB_23]|uniref:hypothetical protein n=1 Tax=Inquilinus sp. 2KB_23 TaxID=3232979 RepID=UPI003F8DFBF5
MDVLLDGAHGAACHRVADVPQGRRFVCQEGDDHQRDDQGVDFQKQRGQQRERHLAEHQQMDQGFLRFGGRLDIGGTMTKPVSEAGGEPKRQNKIEEDSEDWIRQRGLRV